MFGNLSANCISGGRWINEQGGRADNRDPSLTLQPELRGNIFSIFIYCFLEDNLQRETQSAARKLGKYILNFYLLFSWRQSGARNTICSEKTGEIYFLFLYFVVLKTIWNFCMLLARKENLWALWIQIIVSSISSRAATWF